MFITSSVKGALELSKAISLENDIILVTGSLFVVGEARDIWSKKINFKLIFSLLLVFSVFIQVLGAYFDKNEWNAEFDNNLNEQPFTTWNWRNSQILYILNGNKKVWLDYDPPEPNDDDRRFGQPHFGHDSE